VVLDADAVVEPRAMMIEALNALVANGTVPAAGRSDDLAVRADLNRVYQLHNVKWVHVFGGMNLACITRHAAHPEYHSEKLKEDEPVSMRRVGPEREQEQDKCGEDDNVEEKEQYWHAVALLHLLDRRAQHEAVEEAWPRVQQKVDLISESDCIDLIDEVSRHLSS
jgi:hypothetical protein